MEKAKSFLQPTDEESESVSRLAVPARQIGVNSCFYEDFSLRGIRVDRLEPGFVACTFKVPPRLTVSHLSRSRVCASATKYANSRALYFLPSYPSKIIIIIIILSLTRATCWELDFEELHLAYFNLNFYCLLGFNLIQV